MDDVEGATLAAAWLHQHGQACFGLVGFACGVAIHRAVFMHGEWHVEAPRILVAHACLLFLGPLLGGAAGERRVKAAADACSALAWGYLPGMALSMLVYRTLLHRLARAGVPGPWQARCSKLWHVWQARGGKNHLVLDALHKKYGDVVQTGRGGGDMESESERAGPAEVTVFTPDVFMAVDGPRSSCVKSEFYDVLQGIGYRSLVSTRDREVHARRRREWRPGFSREALEQYHGRVSRHVDRLIDLLGDDAARGRASNVRDYMYWFGFDAMGDFVFGRPFGMLESREPGPVISRLQNALWLLGPLGPTPWLVQVGLRLGPRVGVIRDWFDTLDWCRGQMRDRLRARVPKAPGGGGDLAHYLMEAGGDERNVSWLTGDSLLAIVAGSDPTTVTLIGAFAEMAKQPEQADKVFGEVADVDASDVKALGALPHLNAVIKEVLRLYPPVPSGGARKTTEQAVVVGGRLIPPHTTIVAPRFTINRREDCFERPLDFVPERWTSRGDMVRDRSGYSPFGTGSRSCLGRFLAEDMMRVVIASVVKRYRFRLGPGETGDRVMGEARDQFVPNPGPLSLCFEERGSACM